MAIRLSIVDRPTRAVVAELPPFSRIMGEWLCCRTSASSLRSREGDRAQLIGHAKSIRR